MVLPGRQNTEVPAFTGEWVNPIYQNDVPMQLPLGCEISLFLNGAAGSNAFRYEGKLLSLKKYPHFAEQVIYLSYFFLNTPYLWGGRSVFGIDCSGFSQLVFKMAGKRLLRDACQQAGQGTPVKSDQAQAGDLAFFTNESGRVVHVGILLEKGLIIHAAGKVRIDQLTAEGIINVDTGLKTHSLSGIRRYS
jgi:cell wall-associated NlpC family hydrolase